MKKLKMKLLSKYKQMEEYNEETTNQETAFFVKQFKGRCRNCGKIGHKGADCWDLEENASKRPTNWNQRSHRESTSPNQRSNKDKSHITCFNCGKKGHYKSECPSNTNNNNETNMMATDKMEEIVFMACEQEPTNYAWCQTCKQKPHTSTACYDVNEDDAYAMLNTTNEATNKNTTQGIWIGDTGASCHMTNSLSGMTKLKQTNTIIQIGDGESITGAQIGTWQGFIINKGSKSRLTLEEVTYVPTLAMNLFSITKALSNKATLSSNGKLD